MLKLPRVRLSNSGRASRFAVGSGVESISVIGQARLRYDMPGLPNRYILTGRRA